MMNHIIRQHFLEVEVNGTESAGLSIQRMLPELCQNRIIPAVEKILDRYSPPNEHLYFERLDIDVGALTLDNLESELAEAIARALEESFRKYPIPAASSPALIFDNVRRKTIQQSVNEAFVYFLKTGRLPWAFRLPDGKNLEQTLLNVWQENTKSTITLDTIFGVLAFTSARKRLIHQFSPIFLATLLARLGSESSKAIQAVLPILHSADVPAADVKLFTQQLWETTFAFVGTGKPITADQLVAVSWRTLPMPLAHPAKLASLLERHWPGSTPNTVDLSSAKPSPAGQIRFRRILSHALKSTALGSTPASSLDPPRLSPANQQLIQAVLQALDKSDLTAFTKTQIEHNLWQTISDVSPTDQTLTEHSLVSQSWRRLPAPLQQAALANLLERHWPGVTQSINQYELATEAIAANEPESTFSASADAKEGIYIENAGLVLLHPFLPQFFAASGIAAEDKLIQPERALCLLHFLTTGQTFAPEYELILSKILCNIPLETPVKSSMELTDYEKEEAEALLEAVIRHWDVLRNTGIDGLRGTFLLRFGKLSLRSDGDWLLQVESKTFDILLNHLPWGIAMIKLPWMQRMLWVEWSH